jgi:hypothetical protein
MSFCTPEHIKAALLYAGIAATYLVTVVQYRYRHYAYRGCRNAAAAC